MILKKILIQLKTSKTIINNKKSVKKLFINCDPVKDSIHIFVSKKIKSICSAGMSYLEHTVYFIFSMANVKTIYLSFISNIKPSPNSI